MTNSLRQQKGAALIIVLLLLSVLTVTAIGVTVTMRRIVTQSSSAADRDNAIWMLRGAEEAALYLLSAQYQARNDVDTLEENWLREEIVLPTEEALIKARFTDRSACFNINHLVSGTEGSGLETDPTAVARFSYLLEALGGDRRSGEMLAYSAADFMDHNDRPEPGGAEDYAYSAGIAPYVTSQHLMVDKSELRAVKSWTGPIYRALSPYLCARPSNNVLGLINVNTLTPADVPVVYAAFDGRVSQRNLETLIEDRPPSGYDSVSAFTEASIFTNLNPTLTAEEQGRFSTYASYIEFSAEVFYGSRAYRMTSFIEGRGGGQYRVISRRLGEKDL